MDISKLDPKIRKIYEELDMLDFRVNMAKDNPDLYTPEEIHEMAEEYPKQLKIVADELTKRFSKLPEDVKERTRYEVHYQRDMTDVREWIKHVQENVSWVMDRDEELRNKGL
ncbi:MAG: hypothetical protein ACOYIK_04770 [Coriobacteriales bacterium]|jgi:hypothetical protein